MSLKKGSFALEVAHKCYNKKNTRNLIWILIELKQK